jgi:hypothetical protein
MKLVDALRSQDTVTENGMTTNSSSLNACVDLFFTIGAMRGQDKQRLISSFSAAFAEDPNRALKILFWVRDVRGGAGERQIFRDILHYLVEARPEVLEKNMHLIPEFGRWDDLLEFAATPLESTAFSLIQQALLGSGNGLCAKWMPRKGKEASRLRKFLDFSPKQYRKTLVNMTDVVETKMCSKDWESIQYGKIPSLASSRYQKAFWKNDQGRYQLYVDGLKKGTEKINASAVYPYDITKSLHSGVKEVAVEQWKRLPNYMEGSSERILPVVDVSGSMGTSAGGNSSISCMDVAISLGLYISERNEGAFKDSFITFSGNPKLQVLKGDLFERFTQLKKADWAMNTDLQKVFALILDQAKKFSIPETEMPTKILILSDMEFDAATQAGRSYGWGNDATVISEWNPTAQQMIAKMYEEAGYAMPSIIYWNIQSRGHNIPVSFEETGTALISGFSPSILKSVMTGEITSPHKIMDATILSERYESISI